MDLKAKEGEEGFPPSPSGRELLLAAGQSPDSLPTAAAGSPSPSPGESGVCPGIQPPRVAGAPSSNRQWKTWRQGPEPLGKADGATPWDNDRGENRGHQNPVEKPLARGPSRAQSSAPGEQVKPGRSAPSGGWRPPRRRGPGPWPRAEAKLRSRVRARRPAPQPRPRRPTFMSLMMVWKRPPSALHSFSITASIFPAAAGTGHTLRAAGTVRGIRASSPREEFHPPSDPPLTRSLSCKEDEVPEIDCSLPKIKITILKAKPLCRVIRLHAALGSWP